MQILKLNSEKGFAAFFITTLITSVVLSIALSIFVLNYGEQKIAGTIVKSNQAYYAAEAGVEDALLRLRKGMDWTNPVVLNVGDVKATTTISSGLGGTKIISSEGIMANATKKAQAVYEISADGASFFYGAQVGDAGIMMDDLSVIDGNVFSNGSVIGESSNSILGTVKVAQSGNKIKKLQVSGDAYASACENCSVSGILYASSSVSCTASQIIPLAEEIATSSLPISQSQITEWQQDALSGGIHSGNYELDDSVAYLGPKKIEGNMMIEGNSRLFIRGTVWVTGSITIQNNAVVKLDPAVYGSFSGVVINDGLITLQNNSISSGSGEAGSYLMYLSTASLNPAIAIKNNAIVDIIYTSTGWIELQNNAQLREITGYGIHLKNNARITYEVGVSDVSFSSGPMGGWKVNSWKEVE